MIDDDLHHDDEDAPEPGTIGVGMGGSCPVCRAPVDLGQEFCLECGSPIRFTPRQRRQPRPGARPGVPAAAPASKRPGFPWVPFLVVLALVGGGVAFALVDDDDSSNRGSRESTTEPALPEITNSVPEETDSETLTTTLQDCDPAQPLGGSEPAVDDGTTDDTSAFDDPNALTDPLAGEQIPEINADGTSDPGDPGADPFVDPGDVPSTEPDTSGATATVDQNGLLCPADGTDTDPAAPVDDPTATDATDPTSTSGTTASGDWPSGKEGWTVIVAGYPNDEARASQRAADVQEDGYDDSGVLFSTDFASLCPGFHVVFSGVFDTKAQAERRLEEMVATGDYADMYTRQVASSPVATGCTTTR